MSRILTMSNDSNLAERISSALAEADFAVSTVSSSMEGLKILGEECFNLIIIDEPLPDADAWSICSQARSFGIPIIFLGRQSEIKAWERAEEANFDFYFKKPFSYVEMIARMKALLRRYPAPSRAAPQKTEIVAKAPETEPIPTPQQVEGQILAAIDKYVKGIKETAASEMKAEIAQMLTEVEERVRVISQQAAAVAPQQAVEETGQRKIAEARATEVEPTTEIVKKAATPYPRALRLLEKMLTGEYVQIDPVVNLASRTGFSYPGISGLLKTDDTKTAEILESLAEHNILGKSFFETLFSCPKCESFQIQLSIHCPKCHSQQLTRCRVLEHFPCGHVAPEEVFATEKGYFCPKCKKELKAIGADYRSLGMHYKCQNCGEFFSSPTEEYHCLKCGASFPKYEAKEVILYGYRFNEAERMRIEAEIKPKEQFIESLSKEGYQVTSPAKVSGKSGREYELDIHAFKKSGALAYKLAIDIAYDEEGVSETEVLKLSAKSSDIDAQKVILIAMPKISRDALPFADQYNVTVIEAKDLEEAAQKLPLEGYINQ